MTQTEKKYIEWMEGRDSGTSSKTILSLLTGITVRQHDVPYDMDDIGRCVRMLNLFPELKTRINEVSEKDIAWMPFIDCWDQLEKGYYKVVKYFETPESELKKLQRRKNHFNAGQYYFNIMERLLCASRYLTGWRCKGSIDYWRREPIIKTQIP
jgi:hypothetical protein